MRGDTPQSIPSILYIKLYSPTTTLNCRYGKLYWAYFYRFSERKLNGGDRDTGRSSCSPGLSFSHWHSNKAIWVDSFLELLLILIEPNLYWQQFYMNCSHKWNYSRQKGTILPGKLAQLVVLWLEKSEMFCPILYFLPAPGLCRI